MDNQPAEEILINNECLSGEGGMIAFTATYGGIEFNCLVDQDALIQEPTDAKTSAVELFDANRNLIAKAIKRCLERSDGLELVITRFDLWAVS